MTRKNSIITCIFVVGLLLTACENEVKNPDTSLHTTQEEGPNLESLDNEGTSATASVAQMYPTKGSEVTTMYPGWEVTIINLPDLRPPSEANKPISGKTSISGLLYAYNISVPLSNMNFVLVPAVINDGVPIVPPILTYGNPLDGDILARTDEDGIFYVDDILPGKYFLLVNYPDHSEIAVDPNRTAEPLLFEFEADTSYPLGVVMILS